MKKAQGISLNVIIIAAIALLVLVVLSVIYINRMGNWGKSTGDCLNKGGHCEVLGPTETCKDKNADYPTKFSGWSCDKVNNQQPVCCIKAGP